MAESNGVGTGSGAGMSTEEVVRITRETNYGTWRFQKGWTPMHIVDAEGCFIVDAAGSGIWTLVRS